MRTVQLENMTKIRKAVPTLEKNIKIKILVGKSSVVLKGPEYEEFIVSEMLHAIDFGFNVEDALLLYREEYVLEFIEVKEFTRRKNLKDVRARIIGTGGKARKTIEKLTNACIVINGNDIGVIVDSDNLDAVTQGIESLIGGAKHGNVFSYLEKQNISKRRFDHEDLGLREGIE